MTRLLLILALTGCASPDWVVERTAHNEYDGWCLYGETDYPYRITLGAWPEDGDPGYAIAAPHETLWLWAPGSHELGGFWTLEHQENPSRLGFEYTHEGCELTLEE